MKKCTNSTYCCDYQEDGNICSYKEKCRKQKAITYGDKMRAMSDEGLAKALVISSSTGCDYSCDSCVHYKTCFERKLALLQSEVSE